MIQPPGATLRQIAQHSGLSVATLSRALSGHGYLSAQLKEEALKALGQYGYTRRNPPTPRHPALQDTILIITGGLHSTVYSEVIKHVTLEAARMGKRVLTANTLYSTTAEADYLRFAQRRGVYGVIMLSVVETDEIVGLLSHASYPFAMIGRYLPSLDCDRVVQDSYRMGIVAAQMLHRAGHRRMGYLGGHPNSSITQDKQLGFSDQLHSVGLSLAPDDVGYGELDYASGHRYAQQLLARGDLPTAYFVSNDLMAIGMLNALLAAGYAVPRDMSLICCDRTTAGDCCLLPLATLYIDYEQTGVNAVQCLVARHQNPNTPIVHHAFDPYYEAGASIGPPRNASRARFD